MIQSPPLRIIVFIGGWISLLLGCLGLFLPLLPTTPFILLTAFCFSRSSERLHRWLVSHPQLGPLIRDWESSGSIRKTAKIKATVLIVGMFAITLVVVNVGFFVKGLVVLIGLSVLAFIWTRPVPLEDHVLPAKVVTE